jgi:hypothetical protein
MKLSAISAIKFKSNSVTYTISVVLLAFFIIYSLTAIGVAGTLFSSAAGLIAYGIFGRLELAMAATIIVGILLKVLFPGFKKAAEGFASMAQPRGNRVSEGFKDNKDSVEEISARIARMKSGSELEGFGVSEGFTSEAAEGISGSGESAHPAPAPVHAAETEEKDKAVALAEAKDMAGFMDKASSEGLFKLGELPSEAKDGNYIDIGTTIMKSLSSLKPDQINQMTSDTRALLETQKSLMTMLNSMKPMLMDGQNLLSSFSGMFNKTG